MVNVSYFNTIPQYQVNTSFVNDETAIVGEIINQTNTVSNGMWYFFFLLVLAIMIMAFSVDPLGLIKLDFLQSFVLGTGIATLLAGFGLIVGFTNSYSDLTFFGTLFFIGVVTKYISNIK